MYATFLNKHHTNVTFVVNDLQNTKQRLMIEQNELL
jgi:hypothetical protein